MVATVTNLFEFAAEKDDPADVPLDIEADDFFPDRWDDLSKAAQELFWLGPNDEGKKRKLQLIVSKEREIAALKTDDSE